MATTVMARPSFQVESEAKYAVRLGTTMTKPTEGRSFSSARYNYKPRSKSTDRLNYALRPSCYQSVDQQQWELKLGQGDKDYVYQGEDVNSRDQYVLLAKENGGDVEVLIEKVDACRDFNLISTPDESSATNLASRYPHLPTEGAARQRPSSDEDLSGEDNGQAENVFDYRNYLSGGAAGAGGTVEEAPPDGASTPHIQQRPASTTPHARPSKHSNGPLVTQSKRKATESTNSNPKRVKAGMKPPEGEVMSASKRRDIPKVRMDRKASLRIAPIESSDELVLDTDTPVQEKPKGSLALALSGALGHGPISLHSAASSPASQIASPMPRRPEHMDEETFEIDDGDLLESPQRPIRPSDGKANAYNDRNTDVEELELPSPVQDRQRLEADAVQLEHADQSDDEGDDLDQQLALAMAEEDEVELPKPPPAAAESDEESEEE